jgi:NifU-like protein
MSFYEGRIRELFLHPLNVGEVLQPNATGETGSLVCGASLRLTIELDSDSRVITDARFKATGCGYLIAAASVLTETLKELKIEEASTLPTLLEDVFAEHLGIFPPDKQHCAMLCRDALGAAMTAYRTSSLVEWTGDDALICTCFGVSETTIETVIDSASLRTVEQVTIACNAGGGCGSCQPLIEDILDDYLRTRNHE